VPGGVVVIGTPDADAIDLANGDEYVHRRHSRSNGGSIGSTRRCTAIRHSRCKTRGSVWSTCEASTIVSTC
jgi:hypothetical protein